MTRALRTCIRATLLALGAGVTLVSCYPPPETYPYTQLVTERRQSLSDELLKLLPPEQRSLPAAQEEARWLADTAYKAAAGVARVNDSNFPGWSGNILVNWGIQDRGLCWHYQHDLYRELRRRPLHYFSLGCCVRDRSEASEHNCVYITSKDKAWPMAWVLDAWMWNGRLKVDKGWTLDQDRWKDRADTCRMLEQFFPEGHLLPCEFWAVIRISSKRYVSVYTQEAMQSSQYERMSENIAEGEKEHPGKLTNY